MPDLITAPPADPAVPPATPPPAAPEVDTTAPAFIAAVGLATQQALTNHDNALIGKLKDEKKAKGDQVAAYTAFGTPEEITTKHARLAELETAASAAAADTTPEKFTLEVERRMAIERTALEKQNALVEETRVADKAAMATKYSDLEALEMKTWAHAHIDRLLPAEGIKPGATKRIWEEIKDYAVRTATPAGDEMRFKLNEVNIPGAGADGLMDLGQLLDAGTKPGILPDFDMDWYRIDFGAGSDTTRNDGAGGGADKPWHKMTGDEQTVYVDNHTKEEVQAHIDRSTVARRAAA